MYPYVRIGSMGIYVLTAEDAEKINRRRTTGESIAHRIKTQLATERVTWSIGAQAHIGNEVSAGDEFPVLVVKVHCNHPTSVINGQVFLDGTDIYWIQNAVYGYGEGQWCS